LVEIVLKRKQSGA